MDTKLLLKVYSVLPIEVLVKYKSPVSNDQIRTLIEDVNKVLPLTESDRAELIETFDHWYGNNKPSLSEKFKTKWVDADRQDKYNSMHSYLISRNTNISYFLSMYSMIDVHRIEDFLVFVSKNYEASWEEYTCRYSCECGTTSNLYDRSFDKPGSCCTKCGRSRKTWILKSGRVAILTYTGKRLFFGKYTKTFKCYFEPTKFKQYDPDGDKYQEYFETPITSDNE
jgi:hypothetical protein